MQQPSLQRKWLPAGLLGAMMLTGLPAQASLVTLNFSGESAMDLSQAFGGTTLGQFIDSTYGPNTGTHDTVLVTGSLTFDSDTAHYQQKSNGSQGHANYLSAVKSAELSFWGQTYQFDIAGLANAQAYGIQTEASGNTSCLGISACTGTPTTNGSLVIDNGVVQIIDANGATRFANRDSFALYLGGAINNTGTALAPAYTPWVANAPNGDQFSIWAFDLSVVSLPDEDLWNTTALPGSAAFFAPEYLDEIRMRVVLTSVTDDGASITPVLFQGAATNFQVTTPVPEPETYALMLAGLGLLGLKQLRKARRG
jgi:hypothetical protein